MHMRKRSPLRIETNKNIKMIIFIPFWIKMEIILAEEIDRNGEVYHCEFEIMFNNEKHYVKSQIDYTNLDFYLADDLHDDPRSDDEECGIYCLPTQNDWKITSDIPEIRYLCKQFHYRCMCMAQEVNDDIDDHAEEKVLSPATMEHIDNLIDRYLAQNS